MPKDNKDIKLDLKSISFDMRGTFRSNKESLTQKGTSLTSTLYFVNGLAKKNKDDKKKKNEKKPKLTIKLSVSGDEDAIDDFCENFPVYEPFKLYMQSKQKQF